MVLDDGSEVPLTEIQVRATEYTVGENGQEAMPAPLPVTSGYTYAVELSVDEALDAGAAEVQFSEPVAFYLENFLGFPVGETVPVGYLDRDRNVWVPSENGVVIKVLDVSDGKALVDTDGDGAPDSDSRLAALEITVTELEQLASLYLPGTTLWRARIPHFSPWDCNWPYGPPPGKRYPPPNPPRPGDPKDDPCAQGGSIILCQSQVLGEELPITGTPFKLHYQSSWQPGFVASSITVPLTGSEVPEDMTAIKLSVTVAGNQLSWSYAPAPNLTQFVTWNGLDGYGRPAPGQQMAHIVIDFMFPAVYYGSGDYSASFARFPTSDFQILGYRRQAISIRREYRVPIAANEVPTTEFGGWSLDIHHVYQPTRGMLAGTLFQGDGTERAIDSLGAVIETVAGTGYYGGGNGDNEAVRTYLRNPGALAVDANGDVFVVERKGYRIRRFTPGGTIVTVAGTGSFGTPVEGALATASPLGTVEDIALDPQGNLYLANQGSGAGCAVYRIDTSGLIERVAGNGECHPAGATPGWQEGDLARDAALEDVHDIAFAPDGTLYLARPLQVLTVDPTGRLFTVAGNGDIPEDAPADGEAAPEVALYVDNMDVAEDGTVYFESLGAIRTVDSAGRLDTVAGISGILAYPENGANALDVPVPASAMVIGPNREIYCIYDEERPLVYKIDMQGNVVYVAGGQSAGYDGDTGLAVSARLDGPTGLAIGPDGSIYVGDTRNGRVRRIYPGPELLARGEIAFPSEDGRLLFTFDANGRHQRTLSAVTGTTLYQFVYDEEGRLAEVWDRDGNVTTIERDDAGNAVAFVAPGGQRTELAFGEDGYLATVVAPENEATSLTYYDGGLLETLTDPRGFVHRFAYDDVGHLIHDEGPTGISSTLDRTDLDDGYAVTVTSTLGRTTNYEVTRSADGTTVSTVTNPAGAVTQTLMRPDGTEETTYPDGTVVVTANGPDPRWGTTAPIAASVTITTPTGLLTAIENSREVTLADENDPTSLLALTDATIVNDRLYTTSYDAPTQTITRTTPEGRESVVTLDERDHVVRIEADAVAPVSFVYDDTGLLLQRTQEDLTWDYSYDDERNLTAVLEPTGNTLLHAYDAAGRTTQTTLPSGAIYGFGYDDNGNLVSITTPTGTTHSLEFTANDARAAYLPPGSETSYAWTYDLDGAVIETTLPDGRIVERAYDSGGRVSGLSYDAASTSFAYHDPTDLLAETTRRTSSGDIIETIAQTWNGSKVSGMVWSGIAEGSYAYTYDDNHWINQVRFASGDDEVVIPLSRDNDGLVSSAGPFTILHDGPEGATTRVADGVAEMDIGHDGHGRPDTLTQTVAGDTVYAYQLAFDGSGRVVQKNETIGGETHTYDYLYDPDGQLLEVSLDGEVAETYAYDSNGNRTLSDAGGVEVSAEYDAQDRLTRLGDDTYLHDGAGFLEQRGDMTLTYSARGELLEAVLPSGDVVSYAYDGFMRRIARSDSQGVEQYFYGDPDRLERITHIRHTDGSLSTLYYTREGRLFALQRDGATYYVATDQVGSLRLVVDSSGTVVRRVDYDSWGVVQAETGADFDFPFGFGGGLQDPATGLVHMGWRDYDPAAGRWTSRDPGLFNGGQVNVYVYVSNNPVSFWDPLGLFSFGMSAYEGIGGGFKISWVPGKGFSTCFEIGIGLGGGIDVNPTGGLDKTDVSSVFELGGNAGPLGISLQAKHGEKCGDSFGAKVTAGPFSYDTSSGFSAGGSVDDLGKTMNQIANSTKVGAVGKMAAEVCTRWW